MRKRTSGDNARDPYNARAVAASVGSSSKTGDGPAPRPRRARDARACEAGPVVAKKLIQPAVYQAAADEGSPVPMDTDAVADAPAGATALAVVAEPAPTHALEGLPFHDPAALKTQLDTYAAGRSLFIEWLFANLVAGTDYMLIHRRVGTRTNREPCPNAADAASPRCLTCKGKSTLCKPGAEKICGLLQLRPRFRRDLDTWEMLGSEMGVLAVVCELVTPSGVVVAEGRAARHRDADGGDLNKSVKMVQKSAQIDAVLRCAGLSEIFTQDLEDLPAGSNGDAAAGDDDPQTTFTLPRRASTPATPVADPSDLTEKLARSVNEAVARRAGAPPATSAEPLKPKDALSGPRVARLMALLHEAVEAADVSEDAHAEVFDRAREWLGAWVATTQGRTPLTHCSYRVYDELCAQIPVAVAQALEGGARPRPRLVRRRQYQAPRPRA